MIDFDEVAEIQLQLFAELAKKDLEPEMLLQYGTLLVSSFTRAHAVLSENPSDKERWERILKESKKGLSVLFDQIIQILNCDGYCSDKELLKFANLLTRIQYLQQVKLKSEKKAIETKERQMQRNEQDGKLLDISIFDKIQLE